MMRSAIMRILQQRNFNTWQKNVMVGLVLNYLSDMLMARCC